MHLEPHDYRIYYVNIDLRHQYGISVAETQTFLNAKRPQRRGARRDGCYRRLASKVKYNRKGSSYREFEDDKRKISPWMGIGNASNLYTLL